MNLQVSSSNNNLGNDKGVFSRVKFKGKDFVLDQIISQAKESLFEIQTDMESVFLNGDREKARSDLLKSKKHPNYK